MRPITFIKCIISIIVLLNFYSCVWDSEFKDELVISDPGKIELKYFEGSYNMSQEEVMTGLAWSLSYLGAELNIGTMDSAMTYLGDHTIYLDVNKVGFSSEALKAIKTIILEIKSSEAYQTNGYVEMGRFIMLTLNSSYHYYKITGIPETLAEFTSLHAFDQYKIKVINSSVAKKERLIESTSAKGASEIAFLCSEGNGSWVDSSFTPKEYEVMDLMPNGQFRFALYDTNGQLKAAGNPDITLAGKPAKCLWCHESSIQPFFSVNPVFEDEGFLSKPDFDSLRAEQLDLLNEYRSTLESKIDFTVNEHHGFAEKLYLDFMEPSLERLAEEWKVSTDFAGSLLEGMPTHVQHEFGTESLYDRKDIDHLGPLEVTSVPSSYRELSDYEPNFFE